MQAISIRIFLILFIIFLIHPYTLQAATEQRTALVIGNSTYSTGPLKNPVNDAGDMAKALQRAGFTVTLKRNAKLQEMIEAIEDFGNSLKRGGVGLFYYAGHGVQVNNVNYLLPINARINKESDVRFQSVDAGRVLAEMENANNGVNIVILDACRDNPFGKSFRSAARGLAIVVNAPTGTFISYSTGASQVARDGEGRNSPYTKALLANIDKPGLTINKVFMNVRSKVKKETGQVPWELSSLEGDFFFIPGKGKATLASDESPASAIAVTDALDDENKKLEVEQRRLEEERAAFAKQKVLEEKRQKIAAEKERLAAEKEEARQAAADKKKAALEEKRQKIAAEKEKAQQAALERKQAKKKTTLAMAKSPSVSTAGETGRDGRLIDNNDGTLLDTRTNLMWAAKGSGENGWSTIDWANAKKYCEDYRGGGYSDWRMPTLDEMSGLYASGSHKGQRHMNWVWASETRDSYAAYFFFGDGKRDWVTKYHRLPAAIPVRNAK